MLISSKRLGVFIDASALKSGIFFIQTETGTNTIEMIK
jgi:hypothetical protein